ncbi:phosphotransferase enzyme family protein [Dictyobacter aurantiacus]|uniref:Spectinomycin phosphotransferase n=1 Tax=Dictyobacter aurantiacus TaxID=1936993 RepID=A0A401ZKH3_9CHLR|nr:aminoglycoside phosphotransferase family protein [Dictyobacter aurantiacus]GCE07355.1 spectinomycin phosphotransferase [Dictyobacter aurantiacus]
MGEQLGIGEEMLRACLDEYYGLAVMEMACVPGGLDYDAAVYRVVSERGEVYLLKVSGRELYEASYLVPAFLRERGVEAVVAPIPTLEGELWTRLGERTVALYPFIEGDVSWNGMTEQNWRDVGSIFRRIHQVVPPREVRGVLRRETFDVGGYLSRMRAFEDRYICQNDGGHNVPEQVLLASWQEQRATIHRVIERLEVLGGMLQRQAGPLVICHADLHPANLIRARSGHVWIIDWDEVMLAPKERDFLFVGEPGTSPDSSNRSPFFQGYGEARIDWTALTYYRYERVAQDLIACAQNVFFKDHLSEESKEAEASLFQSVLAPGGEIEAAYAAEAHL